MPFDIALIIDLVIAFTAVECVALLLYRRVTGTGVAGSEFLLNLLSGACLMLALRCLARGDGVEWVAAFLLAAGVAHGADLWRRWQRASPSYRTTPLAERKVRLHPTGSRP